MIKYMKTKKLITQLDMIKKIWRRIKKWHAYWVWIEEQRMKAAEHTGSAGPLM